MFILLETTSTYLRVKTTVLALTGWTAWLLTCYSSNVHCTIQATSPPPPQSPSKRQKCMKSSKKNGLVDIPQSALIKWLLDWRLWRLCPACRSGSNENVKKCNLSSWQPLRLSRRWHIRHICSWPPLKQLQKLISTKMCSLFCSLNAGGQMSMKQNCPRFVIGRNLQFILALQAKFKTI